MRNGHDDMPPKYDLESLGTPQKGRYYERAMRHAKLRELSPRLAEQFPDSASVNAALEEYLRIKRESA
ncbi:hypothetical protein GC173_03480 [bacterium]|nr:hypothetical protein [bacterium]